MAKLLSRLFSSSSLSSKRGTYRGSQTSINDTGRKKQGQTTMRSSSSLENISSYYVNSKELDKNKLHKASWEGNLQKVERLAGPAQINVKDQHARTPLHLAVVRGHIEIVRHLVHEGARLDVLDNEKRTPLLKAVLSGNQNRQVCYEICHILLDGGAHAFLNAVDIRGKNALHYAIDFDNEDLAELFVTYPNCDPNFRDADQMTPLHSAVKKNNRHIVESLLSDEHEQQADPNLVNRNGQTPLHLAAAAGYIDIIRVILQAELEEPCDPTIVDSQQLTAYQVAKMSNHDPCANIINEYQQGWTKLSPRRDEFHSINEQEINPVVINPFQQQQQQQQQKPQQQQIQYPQDSSDESTSDTSSESSRSSLDKRQSQPNQWSPYRPNESKPETRTLADLIKTNPVQPPNIPHTNPSKPADQTLSNMMHNIPLQPPDSSTYKPVTPQPKQQPPSIFGIGPAGLQHHETDRSTSTSMSIDKALIGTSLIAGQIATKTTASPPQKPSTINALVNALPQPTSSNSFTYDSTYPNQQIKQARKINSWTDSSPSQSDDDDTGVYNTKTPQTQQLPSLNGTAMFTTTPASAITHQQNFDESKSDDDSIEAALKENLNKQIPSNGVQNIINKQLGNAFKFPQQQQQLSSIPNQQSPLSDDSTWTQSSSVTINKGIESLIQQQPLTTKKSNEHTWDDSRPLSADLKRTSIISDNQRSTQSDDTDDDEDDNDPKSSTIVKSPFLGTSLSNLVQKNIQPNEYTDIKSTAGVDNLVKIINEIMHSTQSTHQKSISPHSIGNIVISPLVRRDDSLTSSASSYADDTVRPLALTAPAAINTKQQLYNDGIEQQTWSGITGDGHDLKLIKRNFSNEMIQQSQRQSARASTNHDFNSLRGSMSSSTSSIQNNIERISELKEDIKQIERKQEDSLELKRQLKDMEIKKNNFEALYKKNDQLLRETETKLEKEIGEKQRLEWTTKNLNMELKNIKQRLQALEEEKDILNQRCLKLKEERDNYDEKLRIHQANSLQTTATAVLREEDIEKIKLRHREEMKLLSAENDELHQRTKQLQSDLQLHKESLDVTIRYKIDLEKALEEKTFLQHELDRLKHEKDYLEQEKIEYKTKNDNLQEEIRLIVADRSKLEQKLNNELQDQIKQRQRSTDDAKKYKTQIEQLNIKLGDAEARLLVLQTQNEALIASKDREIKNEFESLTHRLNLIESDKLNAEQRYHNEHKEITNRQQQQQHPLHEPLLILGSSPLNNPIQHQHSPSSTCTKCDTLQKSYEHEREQRIQTEKEYARLRDVVSRQQNENYLEENNKQLRTEHERVKAELERLRQDMDKLVLNYDPSDNYQQKAQLHSKIDSFRKFHEQEFHQRQQLPISTKIQPTMNGHHHTKHNGYDHGMNGNANCSICSNSRLLKERLDNAIDTSLADQRIQTIKQMPILPRQTAVPLLTINTNDMSSVQLLRKRYYL